MPRLRVFRVSSTISESSCPRRRKLKAAELEADLNRTKGDPQRLCLELQDALSKHLQADAVVQARRGVQFPDGRGLLDKLNGLNAWCKVTVLHLECCGLGEGGGRALAEALRLNTSLKVLDHCNHYGGLNYAVGLGEGGGRALAEALRLSTTLTSLNLYRNGLGEGGGEALAETLRINAMLTSLNLRLNGLGEGGGRAIAAALRENHALTSLVLDYNSLGEGGAQAIAAALRVNSTVTSLALGTIRWERAQDRLLLRHCAKITRSLRSTWATMSWERAQHRQLLRHCA